MSLVASTGTFPVLYNLWEKNKTNQEVDTSIYVQIHKDNNTEPDPELNADTGL